MSFGTVPTKIGIFPRNFINKFYLGKTKFVLHFTENGNQNETSNLSDPTKFFETSCK